MFEKIAMEFLNKVFGNYFEDIDNSKLRVSVWKGDVVLSNLIVKQTAMDNLYLPFQVVAGKVGTLIMQIPWQKIYTAPVELILKDLHVVARPSQTIPYNQEEEERQEFLNKIKKVEEIEEVRREAVARIAQQANQPGAPPEAPALQNTTFQERLMMHIIRNVQIRIESIHIRFEDTISNATVPFSFGVMLNSLNVRTTDATWAPIYIPDQMHSPTFHKLVTLNGLALYLNPDGRVVSEIGVPREQVLITLGQMISSGRGFNHMVGPISAEVKLHLTPSPESITQPPFSLPKALIQVSIKQLTFGISNAQFQDIFRLAETIEFMARARIWRKYRPAARTYKGNYKAWWKFAYACVMVEIRRRRDSWNYANIKKHIQLCKDYADSYTKKFILHHNRNDLEEHIQTCERKLSLFNILLVRQQIEVKKQRIDKLETEIKKKHGWISNLLGWSAADIGAEITARLGSEWTAAESAKLMEAIGYTEKDAPMNCPEGYVLYQIEFQLKLLNMVVLEFVKGKQGGEQLLQLKIEDIFNKTQYRPVRHGLSLEWKVGNLQADTLPSPDGLITQVVKGVNIGVGEYLLEFKYDKYPVQSPNVNGKITCVAKPLEFIYHTRTVHQLVQCFKVPSEIQLRKLRSNAASRIKEWKQSGSENLKRIVQNKTDGEFLLDINVAAPYFIIPQNGELDENSNVLIIDLGQLRVKTSPRENPSLLSPNTHIYTMELKNVQVLVALPGNDNRSPSTRPSHIFHNPNTVQSIQVLVPSQVPGPSSAIGNPPAPPATSLDTGNIYNPAHRSQTLAEVLNPSTMTLVLTKTNSVSIEIEISDIFIRLSAGTVELLQRISKSWTASTEAAAQVARQAIDRSNMWKAKPNTVAEFPFLKTSADVLVSPSNSADRLDLSSSRGTNPRQSVQSLVLKPTVAIFTFEVGENVSTTPLLFLETKLEAEVYDWSQQISVKGKIHLAAACSNTNLGMWEYLIEPVEAGHFGSAMHRPWELRFEISKARTSLKDSSQMSLMATTGETREDQEYHRVFVARLYSDDILELTLTQTAVEVLNKLKESFNEITKAPVSQRQVSKSPYILVNATGSDLKLILQNGPFLVVSNDKIPHSGELAVTSESRVNLELDVSTRYSVLREQEGRVERNLKISIPDYQFNKLIQVNRADSKFYQLSKTLKGTTSTLPNGIVCDVRVKDCSVVVTIRGIVNVTNHLNIAVDVFCMDSKTKKNKFVGIVDANSSWNVPISVLTNYPDGFYFAPAGFSQSTSPFLWVAQLENVPTKSYMICSSITLKPPVLFHMLVSGEVQQIMFENTNRQTLASRTCSIEIRPPLVITNLLTTELHVYAKDREHLKVRIERGRSSQITFLDRQEDADFDLMLKLPSYGRLVYTCNVILRPNAEELTCWEFTSTTGTPLHLGIHKELQDGTVMLYLYSQFWMINMTGLDLTYKQGEDATGTTSLSHPATQSGPLMFSVGCKDFLSAKTARLKVKESDWSDAFFLDLAGSSAIVKCVSGTSKTEHQINVITNLIDKTFTKTVSFKPRFYLINQCPFQVNVLEIMDTDERVVVSVNSKQCIPFWPRSKLEQLRVAIARTDEFSTVFPYNRTHSTVLKYKNRYGAINVHVLVTWNRTTITIDEYIDGQAPVLLINDTKDLSVEFYELEITAPSKGTLLPNTNQLFTWSFPTGKRTIVWSPLNSSRSEIMDQLLTDGSGTFTVNSTAGETTTYYWISFLEKFQRVLLFTDNLKLSKSFENAKDKEVTQVELSFGLSGVGFSLVDIAKCREVLYMRISSVGVSWETTRDPKSNRYRQYDPEIAILLERAYKDYLIDIAASPLNAAMYKLGNDYEVNFAEMIVTKPQVRHLRRSPLQPGLWLYFKKFPHSTQFHLKVNRFQLDNQLPNCTYPVILSQVVPPKSVTTGDESHKPFLNLSLIRTTTPKSESIQFIYSTVLVQEFNLMTDVALAKSVMAVFDLTSRQRERVEEMSEYFQKTWEIMSSSSEKYFSRKLQFQGQQLHIENLQLSPIKLHLSFSVTQSKDDTRSIGHLFLRSIGVTMGSAQDVVFKLAGLELKHMCLTTGQLIHEVKTHYTSQATKQLYAYFFGLDLIGNPISYLSGVTEGIETFFYEPIQGAILGPEEFAEGLSLGLKSLVGHAVGGTADALSKITGVLGKGVAMLSLDEEYQRNRRTAMGSRMTLGECTKTFIKTGIVDPVVGVVASPIIGAYYGGLSGLGMGLVKGTLGLVARPLGAAMDLASGTFGALKRATKPTEDVPQIRPPRFMERNRGIEPYVRQVAEGALIFKELNAQRQLPPGEHYVAHIATGAKDVPCIFLITETRAFYLKLTDMYGKSTIQWEHVYDEFTGPPMIQETERGLSFMLRSNRKRPILGFSKNVLNQDEKVFVPVADAEICVWILSKITDAMSNHATSQLQPQDPSQQVV